MATKNMEIKKMARMEQDRLSNLPEDLKLRIVSLLDIKESARTSVLSKTWVCLWTRNPVLKLYDYFHDNLYAFDKFVNRVLHARDQSAGLDSLIFMRNGTPSAKILKTVFNYAFSHGIKQLEAYIGKSRRNHTWLLPVCPNTSFDSLTSLKLVSKATILCPFLGPRFKNLTCLYLTKIFVTDHLDPFSGFPVLEKLTLLDCGIATEGKTLSIRARNLTDLSISGYTSLKCCNLTTPRLRFFGYRGYDFPRIQTHEGLLVLDNVAIDFNGAYNDMHEKRTLDDLLSLLCAFPNATSLTLYWATVEILSFFPDELLVNRRSPPFRNLKCLKLDFRNFFYQTLHQQRIWPPHDSFRLPSDVKDYLFLNSPNPKVTTKNPHYRNCSGDSYGYRKSKDVLFCNGIF